MGFNTTYQGLIPRLEASFLSKEKEGFQKGAREFVDRAVTQVDCPACGGTRLAQHALESKINGKNIAELRAMEVADLAQWFDSVEAPGGCCAQRRPAHADRLAQGARRPRK